MKVEIHPVAPFDFQLTCWIFADGGQEGEFKDDSFHHVLRVDDKLTLLTLRSIGTIRQPRLIAEFEPELDLSTEEKRHLRDQTIKLFNLDLDLAPFYRKIKKDKTMLSVANQLVGLRSPTTPTVFEALISSIIEQQISLRVAGSLEKNIIETYGDELRVRGKNHYAFPTPESLANATEENLFKCGLSHRKAEYVHNLSELVRARSLDLEQLQKRDSAEIIKVLDAVRGIGLWTAKLAMIRGMQKFDVMPADDLGLRRTIAHYYANGRSITSEEATKIGENWGNWKGLASYYLIVALGLDLKASA